MDQPTPGRNPALPLKGIGMKGLATQLVRAREMMARQCRDLERMQSELGVLMEETEGALALIDGYDDQGGAPRAQSMVEDSGPGDVVPLFLTRKMAAARLGISLRTLDRMAKKGEITYRKVCSGVRFDPKEVEAAAKRVNAVEQFSTERSG